LPYRSAGIVSLGDSDTERTSLDFASPGPQTLKSSYNRLLGEPAERV
jgi:hypothetical protein